MPPFALTVNSGSNSIISDFLAPSKTSFRQLSLNVSNDSLVRLAGKVVGITAGDTRIDTVGISAMQHGKFLLYRARMNNRPGTFDEFAHVNVTGFLADRNLALFLNQSISRMRPALSSVSMSPWPTLC